MSFAEITSKECDKFYEKKHCLSVNEMKVLTIIKAKYVNFAKYLLNMMSVHDYENDANEAEAQEEERIMKELLSEMKVVDEPARILKATVISSSEMTPRTKKKKDTMLMKLMMNAGKSSSNNVDVENLRKTLTRRGIR